MYSTPYANDYTVSRRWSRSIETSGKSTSYRERRLRDRSRTGYLISCIHIPRFSDIWIVDWLKNCQRLSSHRQAALHLLSPPLSSFLSSDPPVSLSLSHAFHQPFCMSPVKKACTKLAIFCGGAHSAQRGCSQVRARETAKDDARRKETRRIRTHGGCNGQRVSACYTTGSESMGRNKKVHVDQLDPVCVDFSLLWPPPCVPFPLDYVIRNWYSKSRPTDRCTVQRCALRLATEIVFLFGRLDWSRDHEVNLHEVYGFYAFIRRERALAHFQSVSRCTITVMIWLVWIIPLLCATHGDI